MTDNNSGQPQTGCPQTLVFTDLDGTLLDPDSYSFEAAVAELQQLEQLNIPVIPCTSKTAAEVESLRQTMHNRHPFVVENGGTVASPLNYFDAFTETDFHTLTINNLGTNYSFIRHLLEDLRQRFGFSFTGFADMSVDELAGITGLTPADAALARQRASTEPLLWQDSDDALNEFRRHLQESGLRLLAGGRFLHVMGMEDKADGMRYLLREYQGIDPNQVITTIAAGDAETDRSMLSEADIAIVIPGRDGSLLDVHGRQRTLTATQPGDRGWSECMRILLDEMTH